MQPQSGDNIFICAKRNDPFARVPKDTLDNPRLSFKAKGILSYLIGKPSGWKLRVADLAKHGREGEKAIRSGLQELRREGYCELVRKTEKGKLVEWVWKLSDSPIFKKPDAGFAHVENAHVENRNHSKKEITKNEVSKKKTEESKETAQSAEGDFSPLWKPNPGTKQEQLRKIRTPSDFPSQREFEQFMISEGIVDILENYRPGLYSDLCDSKWHQWRKGDHRWIKIYDWKAFVKSLAEKIAETFES